MDLVKDIKDSAMGPNGYLYSLENCRDLQAMYENAINLIYGESNK